MFLQVAEQSDNAKSKLNALKMSQNNSSRILPQDMKEGGREVCGKVDSLAHVTGHMSCKQ